MRVVVALLAVAACLSACVGSTESATDVASSSARLNAKGYADDGPARWWWEYDSVRADLGTANDIEVCNQSTRCGPASAGSASSPVPLNTVVSGLTPATTYYFRACGQDSNDPAGTCAQVHSFRTTAGTSTAGVSAGVLTFNGAADTTNLVHVSRFTDSDGVAKYRIEDWVSGRGEIVTGSTISPGTGCQPIRGQTYANSVKCLASGVARIRLVTNDGDDETQIYPSVTIPTTQEGGAGRDGLSGGAASSDTLVTGPEGNWAFADDFAGGSDDTIDARNGADDIIWCGGGTDVALVDPTGDRSLEEVLPDLNMEPWASCEQVDGRAP
jgi:hypothetical protein